MSGCEAGREKALGRLKTRLHSILVTSHQEWHSVQEVERDYRKLMGAGLPWEELGFDSSTHLVLHIRDAFHSCFSLGKLLVKPKDKAETRPIADLVKGDAAKRKKRAERERPRTPPQTSPPKAVAKGVAKGGFQGPRASPGRPRPPRLPGIAAAGSYKNDVPAFSGASPKALDAAIWALETRYPKWARLTQIRRDDFRVPWDELIGAFVPAIDVREDEDKGTLIRLAKHVAVQKGLRPPSDEDSQPSPTQGGRDGDGDAEEDDDGDDDDEGGVEHVCASSADTSMASTEVGPVDAPPGLGQAHDAFLVQRLLNGPLPLSDVSQWLQASKRADSNEAALRFLILDHHGVVLLNYEGTGELHVKLAQPNKWIEWAETWAAEVCEPWPESGQELAELAQYNGPSSFFLIRSCRSGELQETCMAELNAFNRGPYAQPLEADEVAAGRLAAAPYYQDGKDQGFHRIKCLGPPGKDGLVRVCYADYGTLAEVAVGELRRLRSSDLQLPLQGTQAALWTPTAATAAVAQAAFQRFFPPHSPSLWAQLKGRRGDRLLVDLRSAEGEWMSEALGVVAAPPKAPAAAPKAKADGSTAGSSRAAAGTGTEASEFEGWLAEELGSEEEEEEPALHPDDAAFFARLKDRQTGALDIGVALTVLRCLQDPENKLPPEVRGRREVRLKWLLGADGDSSFAASSAFS